MTEQVDLAEAAIWYAKKAIPVFPCRSSGVNIKAPRTANGYKDATTDIDQVERWWSDMPGAAIGIPTGAPWHTVLDIDVHPDGDGAAALEALRLSGLLTGCVRIVGTPSGGLHLYFIGNAEPSHAIPHQHLDLKGVGGYVLAPPSRLLIDGDWRTYQVEATRESGLELDWASCSKVLSDFSPDHSATGGLAMLVERAPSGSRNSTLYWAARRATEQGLSTAPLLDAALKAGLPEDEASRAIGNGVRAAGATR